MQPIWAEWESSYRTIALYFTSDYSLGQVHWHAGQSLVLYAYA